MTEDTVDFQVVSSNGDFSIYRKLLLVPAVLFGIAGQIALSKDFISLSLLAYGSAILCAVIGVQPSRVSSTEAAPSGRTVSLTLRIGLCVLSVFFGGIAFLSSAGNLYRIEGVIAWILSLLCWLAAWAEFPPVWFTTRSGSQHTLSTRQVNARYCLLGVLVIIFAIALAFRYANLAGNPLEMNSDQAEKLLDVGDVLNGIPHIFFERNTGREPWQFYWTVLLIKLFSLKPDFMVLKLGTAFIGFLMVPGIYLLAREVAGTRTALIASLFAAVASWGVITARFGLRYPLAPCAVAWTMYFMVRGLRRQERNSMLAAGVSIGIGLQGYTAYRFMIVVVPAIILIWLAWLQTHKQVAPARGVVANGILAFVAAVLVLMPLIRYGTEKPDLLFYRAATRLGDAEQPLNGSPISIFADNLKNVLLMFNYTHDEVWVANLPDRPAMDEVLGALLVLGVFASFSLSIQARNPWPTIVLLSGIMMLIPSALSLAFPRENPSVVRTGGALPMLMIVCAYVPASLLRSINQHGSLNVSKIPVRFERGFTWFTVLALSVSVIVLNYQRVFVDYPAQYCPRAQDASDIAREMDTWVSAGNNRLNAWIVGFPHWVDSRAVGVWIGDIHFPNTVGSAVGLPDVSTVNLAGKSGWFALNEADTNSLLSLARLYPDGTARVVVGRQCVEKRFVVFTTQ